MFIRYYVELAHPMSMLEHTLLQAPASWMPEMAVVADERHQRLLTEVGFPIDGRYRIAKRVAVQIGEAIHSSSRTLVPISWRATGPSGLFPILDGDLELAPIGGARTQLALSAQYRPPLGLIGRTFDRTLLARVAEATVKDFVDRIAHRLEAQLALNRLT
ncbi:MAG TPA: hypothetical protein VET65_14250 [Candidatus Limnocylindrales bacterium]|nr:hypothetical protein [Candidatus Limnocylindrales bacterium]